MNKETLIKAKALVTMAIKDDNSINNVDALELIINLNHFLEPLTYDENIKVLEEARVKSMPRRK